MTWDSERFYQLIKEKLGDDPITSIELNWFRCSNTTLNELLAVLYLNMAEGGLRRLEFCKFPKQCELDPNLLTDIAK